LKLKYIIFWSS